MVGTDIFHAAMLSTAAAAGHIVAGDVNYNLVGSLLLGAIPGILIGGKLTVRMPEKALRPALGAVLLATGIITLHPIHAKAPRPSHKITSGPVSAPIAHPAVAAQVVSASGAIAP